MLAAFAVDEGSLYLERRHLQNLTDLAAIAAAADAAEPGKAAEALFKANGVDGLTLLTTPGKADLPNTLLVQTGRYVPDPGVEAARRFKPGAEPVNAARVTVRTIGTTYFASRLLPKPAIGTTATASASNLAAFSIGSRLIDVDTKDAAPVINALLGNLLGTDISLSAVGYDALLGADVKLLGFLTALAGKAHIQAGTYDEVLQSDVSIGQFVSALAEVSSSPDAKAALKAMAAGLLSSDLTVPLSHFVSLGPVGRIALGGEAGGLELASASVMALLSAGAVLADGKHQVALALNAGLPGIASATIDLAIGEPPQNSAWFSVGEKGDIVRTAQTRLSLVVAVGGSGGLLGGLLGLSIRVPVYVELAYAEGKLGDIACPTGRPESLRVTVGARPGVAEAWIGEVDTAGMRNFAKSPPVLPAELVKAPLVTVTGTAHATISNPTQTQLIFSANDIEKGTVNRVSTHDFTGSLFGSLLGDLQLDVKVAGLGLGLGDVGKTLANTLGVASPAIDTLLNGVLATLGIKLGEADVRVTGATCGRSALVQ
jgi:uncharacterized membrane protein